MSRRAEHDAGRADLAPEAPATGGGGATVPDVRSMRAAFIVGVARSGTSLLVSLLDGHPELLMLPYESKAFEWCGADDPVGALLATRYGRLFPEGSDERARLEARMRADVPGPVPAPVALEALVRGVLHARPPAAAPALWVEKTPKHLRSAPLLARWFGEQARFVCMVRDPRAVAASQAKRWGRAGPQAIARFCRRWAAADRITRDLERTLPGFRVVRYEDLVADGEATMRAVAGHLGVSWSPSLLVPSRRGEAWLGNSSFGERGQGLTTSAVDRWRTELPPAEIALIERALGPRMVRRGYEPGAAAGAALPLRRLCTEGAAFWSTLRERRRWARG